ncbi:hypothetical protein BH10ACI4_BH10ACI4_13520 [soil metagenome]
MSESTETAKQITGWSLFVLALPLSAFISFMGRIGTGFGGLTDSIPLLLMLPIQACAFYSFRLASAGLWTLLVVHLLLPFRSGFTRFAWNDLAPTYLDTMVWAVAILMGIAAWVSSNGARKNEARKTYLS